MLDRKLKQALRANVLLLSDAALTYLREEVQREQNRRRLQTRQRRKAKAAEPVGAFTDGI